MLSFVADFETLKPVTIIIAFLPVHEYTLKFGENNFLSFFLKMPIQRFSLYAWLPPVFFLDFNSP